MKKLSLFVLIVFAGMQLSAKVATGIKPCKEKQVEILKEFPAKRDVAIFSASFQPQEKKAAFIYYTYHVELTWLGQDADFIECDVEPYVKWDFIDHYYGELIRYTWSDEDELLESEVMTNWLEDQYSSSGDCPEPE